VRRLKDPSLATTGSGVLTELAQIKWKGRGLTPTRHLKNFGLLDDHLLAAHAIHLDEQDIALLAETGVKIAHCPRSNARLRNGRAPLGQIRAAHIPFGLGTDSLASCDDLDLLQEARFATAVHRTVEPDIVWTSADILKSLTIDAARILGLENLVGSIDPGKLADIAVFAINPLEYGQDDPYDLLIHGKTTLVDLFVDGSIVVSAGQLVNN
jgi:5-methylthioadenosine/S-adenosylhomocysteine deaminase